MKTLRNLIICFVLLCGAAVLMAQVPQWQWATQAGGIRNDFGWSIAIDSEGNQYVTGPFRSTATFGSHTLTSSGSEFDYSDIFIAKLDPNGNWLWAVQAGGDRSDIGQGIATDGEGNVYVTGAFEGTASFGGHTLTASGSEDIFVAKLDADGNWIWAVRKGRANDDAGLAIALDVAGNVYVTGHYKATASFGGCAPAKSADEEDWLDVFVAKLDADGNWIWTVVAGGAAWERAEDIALDNEGNAYVTGWFEGTASFGGHNLTACGGSDIFVAKLDTDGNWLWAIQAGAEGVDAGFAIALDAIGNAYVTGCFRGTTTFGGHSLTSKGMDDIFFAKLDADGNWLWAVQAGGTESDVGKGITFDGAGNAYVTGDIKGTATFDSHTLTASGDREIFVAKLVNITPIDDAIAPQVASRLHDAWPNPFGRGTGTMIKADIPERSTGTLSIYNLRGQRVARYELSSGSHEINFAGENLPAGVYLYSLQSGSFREIKKLVLLR